MECLSWGSTSGLKSFISSPTFTLNTVFWNNNLLDDYVPLFTFFKIDIFHFQNRRTQTFLGKIFHSIAALIHDFIHNTAIFIKPHPANTCSLLCKAPQFVIGEIDVPSLLKVFETPSKIGPKCYRQEHTKENKWDVQQVFPPMQYLDTHCKFHVNYLHDFIFTSLSDAHTLL